MKLVLKVLLIVILVAGIALLGYWVLTTGQLSYVHLKYAEHLEGRDQHQAAAKHYEKALEIKPKDSDIRVATIEYYYKQSNYTKAEYHLLEGINIQPSYSWYYTELSRIYVEQSKLYDAEELLTNLPSQLLKQSISKSRPLSPVLNPAPGSYRDEFEITLSSEENLKVFYSIDGSFPTTLNPYKGAITPESGEITVVAVAVNDAGLVSPPVKGVYRYEPEIPSVTLADPGVESVVRSILRLPEGDISSGSLRSIASFSNTVGSEVIAISDLSDFTWLSGLETLELTYVRTPLDPLADLTRLRALSLHNCNLSSSSIAPLATLDNLEFLDLSENLLGSANLISTFSKLDMLILRGNSIVDITPLEKMTSLQSLDLGNNAIEDISPLSKLTNITHLSLDSNKISDLTPLGKLSSLISLNASSNVLTDISGLESCVALETLDISHNSIASLSPLSSNRNLISLSAVKNQISDISPLSTLEKLNIANFSTNEIVDLTPLGGCTQLTALNISKNFISDVSPLSSLMNLSELNMEHNAATNIDSLALAPNLKTVYAFGNKLTNVTALEEVAITVYK